MNKQPYILVHNLRPSTNMRTQNNSLWKKKKEKKPNKLSTPLSIIFVRYFLIDCFTTTTPETIFHFILPAMKRNVSRIF